MATEDEGTIALKLLNGRELAGRPIRVEVATSQRRPFERAGFEARR
jgi:RNA recognition motif-containing protein